MKSAERNFINLCLRPGWCRVNICRFLWCRPIIIWRAVSGPWQVLFEQQRWMIFCPGIPQLTHAFLFSPRRQVRKLAQKAFCCRYCFQLKLLRAGNEKKSTRRSPGYMFNILCAISVKHLKKYKPLKIPTCVYILHTSNFLFYFLAIEQCGTMFKTVK
jgi:hypothetical protein